MTTSSKMQVLTIDDLFDKIGHLGSAQLSYFLTLATLQFFACSQMLLNIFQGIEPKFQCLPKDYLSSKEETSLSTPKPLNQQCYNNSINDCHIIFTDNFTTLASEFSLVCNEKYKVALVQSVWMTGVMCGSLFLGSMADIIGRIRCLLISILCTIAFEFFSAFAPTYYFFIILRFFGGMSCSIVILVSFVLSQEFIGTSKRSICGVLMAIFFAIGIALLSTLASFIHDWRSLGIITSLSGIIFIFIPLYVPESPRWLLSKGKEDEARLIIENIAIKNKTENNLPSHWQLASAGKTSAEVSLFRELTQHNYVIIIMMIQIFSWFVNSLSYYALTMAASDMGGDIYISTAINGLVEIPACLLSIFLIDRIGRRISICGFMIVGGVSCLMIQMIPPSQYLVTTMMALFGKLSVAASFSIIYIHSGEIFPTPMRNTCMGVVSVAARVGGIVSPFILMLGDLYPNLQFTVLGMLMFSSGFLNLKLPETQGKPMPQSVKDILNLRSDTDKIIKYTKLFTEEESGDSSDETLEFVRLHPDKKSDFSKWEQST